VGHLGGGVSGGFLVKIGPLQEEISKDDLSSPSCEDTARGDCLQTRRRVLTRNQICSHFDLGLPCFQNYKN
jgi:hypothetical protein